MALNSLNGRVAKLEKAMPVPQTVEQEALALWKGRTLIIFRYPEETEAEAAERWGIDVTDWGKVCWRIWHLEGLNGREIFAPAWLPGPHENYDLEKVLTEALARIAARREQARLERGE